MNRRSLTSYLLVVPASLMLLISGCARMQQPRELGWCTVGGIAVGAAIGAGAGYGVGEASKGHDGSRSRVIAGSLAGAGIGAIVGGVLGHYLCDPLVPPPPPPPPPREKLVLRGVHFDFNKANIRPGDAAVLDEAATTLKANPNITIDVNGYCDAIGGEEYNLRLSDRRSNAVVEYLVQQGVPASRLVPHGFGKTNFVAPNETPEGRAQNRRVELVPED